MELAIAHEANWRFRSDPLGPERPEKVINPVDIGTPERQQYVALSQPCLRRRAVGL
jgi:hypothetical protein